MKRHSFQVLIPVNASDNLFSSPRFRAAVALVNEVEGLVGWVEDQSSVKGQRGSVSLKSE